MATGTARPAQDLEPVSVPYISPMGGWRQSLIRALIRAALLAVLQIGRSAANRSVEFAKLLFFGLGSLSSRSDGRRLRQPETREEVADAIETVLAQ